jgi:hypothetical protein
MPGRVPPKQSRLKVSAADLTLLNDTGLGVGGRHRCVIRLCRTEGAHPVALNEAPVERYRRIRIAGETCHHLPFCADTLLELSASHPHRVDARYVAIGGESRGGGSHQAAGSNQVTHGPSLSRSGPDGSPLWLDSTWGRLVRTSTCLSSFCLEYFERALVVSSDAAATAGIARSEARLRRAWVLYRQASTKRHRRTVLPTAGQAVSRERYPRPARQRSPQQDQPFGTAAPGGTGIVRPNKSGRGLANNISMLMFSELKVIWLRISRERTSEDHRAAGSLTTLPLTTGEDRRKADGVVSGPAPPKPRPRDATPGGAEMHQL